MNAPTHKWLVLSELWLCGHDFVTAACTGQMDENVDGTCMRFIASNKVWETFGLSVASAINVIMVHSTRLRECNHTNMVCRWNCVVMRRWCVLVVASLCNYILRHSCGLCWQHLSFVLWHEWTASAITYPQRMQNERNMRLTLKNPKLVDVWLRVATVM